MNNRQEIKEANRKALPRFIIYIILAGIGGGIFGYISATMGLESLGEYIPKAGDFFALNIAPWILIALPILELITCIPIYRKAKAMAKAWDGEDDEMYDRIDQNLNIVLSLTTVVLIIGFFLLGVIYSRGTLVFGDGFAVARFGLAMLAFMVSLILGVVLQQHAVDTVKELNPEKAGSVYEMKFRQKWMDSSDEAEKILVGKCAYDAFVKTNITCMILAAVLAVAALFLDIGFLPSLVVCVIWFVNQGSYALAGIKYSKAGNSIL